VTLAAASGAVVIGFNNKIDVPAKRAAEQTKVDVRQYKVIYELLDDMQKALTGMLEPEMVESVLGHAEVRQIFTANKTTIAGCMVSDGVIRRGAQARLLRGQEPAWEGTDRDAPPGQGRRARGRGRARVRHRARGTQRRAGRRHHRGVRRPSEAALAMAYRRVGSGQCPAAA